MIQWWQALSARERALLSVGGCAVLALVLFLGVLEPLHAKHQRLTLQVDGEQKILVELQGLAAEAARFRATRGSSVLPPGQTLLAVLNATAASSHLDTQIKRVVPNGEQEASIAFDEVGFDQLLEWLILIREQHGIQVARIVVDKAGAPGQVNANLTLSTL